MSKIRRRVTASIPMKRFLTLTPKGLMFVKGWFGISGHIPSNVTRLYQLLLSIVSRGGVMSVQLAIRTGYDREIIEEAVSKAYVDLTRVSRKPEKEVLKGMTEMMSEPTEQIYI